MPIGLWMRVGDDFVCADVNQAMCRLSGRSREEFAGATVAEMGGNQVRAKRDMLAATTTGKSTHRNRTWVLPSGEVRHLQVAYVSLGAEHLLVFVHDVTQERETDARLRLTENRYKTLVGTANQGVWLVTPAGATVFANRAMARILDRPYNDLADANLLDFVDPGDRATVAGALECPRDTPDAFEVRFRTRDGGELLCLASVSGMPSETGREETLCVVADMTAAQRERELRMATERRFRRMVETASEGVWTGDRDGRTTFVNKAAARMLGVDREEIIGRPFTDFIVYDAAARSAQDKLQREGVPVHGEFRLRRADGGYIDAIASVSVLPGDGGEVAGAVAMVTDVTQMKREQAELAESRERFAQVFEEAPVGIAFIGAGRVVRGRFLAANSAFHELLGYSDQALIEEDMFTITHPDDVERERALATELFEHRREEYSLDKRFVRPDGSVVWARFRAHVLRDEHGAPLYALGLAVDITAERSAIERAKFLDTRLNALLATTTETVLELGADGTIVAVNEAGLLLFGAERGALVGKPLTTTLVPERLRTRVAGALAQRLDVIDDDAAQSTETTLQRVDGSEIPVELRIVAVPAGDRGRLLLFVRNLGLRDRAELAQREADARFERLFRDSPGAVLALDAAGRVVDLNPAFCRLAQRDAAALIGRPVGELLADAGDATEPPWQSRADRPGPRSLTLRLLLPDGRAVPLRLTASPVRDASGAPVQWLCHCVAQALGDGRVPDLEDASLSYRERQVLGLLARGHDGPAVAERLGLAPETVRSYANGARNKLGAKTRTEAVALALVRGEISI